MLTPLDIESKVFSKSFSGYNVSEVKIFLKEILTYYEMLYKENIELKDKVNTLQEGIQYYKNIEETLHNTLVLAEKTAEETKALARQKAEQIEKEAQLKADLIINDSKNEVCEINKAKNELIRSFDLYKIQMKQFLKSQLEIIETCNLELPFNQSTFDLLFNAKNFSQETNLEAAITKESDNKEDSNEEINERINS